jgi:thymidylate synthase ThyX
MVKKVQKKRKGNTPTNNLELITRARELNPPLPEVYSKTNNPKEEANAKRFMKLAVTDPEGSIYGIRPIVPELFAALQKARYSRTDLSARQLLWREFVAQKTRIPWKKIEAGIAAQGQVFNYERGEGVAERILLQYGDDSVFELGGGHLFLDRISMVATKVVEDARIGLSPLEKSTRYVVYDQKGSDGDYSFFKDPRIMDSHHREVYLDATRACFELYAQSVAQLMPFFEQQIPIESQSFPDLSKPDSPSTPFKKLKDERSIRSAKTAYRFSVRAKACDVARVLLPASTLTNVGEFGNARAYGYLFTKMMANPLAEMQMIAYEGTREMKKVLPKFLDIVDNNYGQAYQEYLRLSEEAMKKRSKELLAGKVPDKTERVELVKMDKNPEVNIAAALLYPYADLPLSQLITIIRQVGDTVRGDILHDSLKFRKNRRHKPPRAFEIAGYELVYDILGNFGIYRDLHRQRVLTQQRQQYTTQHGFDMPLEFAELGLEEEFAKVMIQMDEAHKLVGTDFPIEAQYLTTMANYTRWYMGMNLREAFWMTELRSTPQGHFSYRTIAQDMFLKAKERYSFLKNLSNMGKEYVDMSDRSHNLERMEAMQRIEVKLARIENKYS